MFCTFWGFWGRGFRVETHNAKTPTTFTDECDSCATALELHIANLMLANRRRQMQETCGSGVPVQPAIPKVHRSLRFRGP